MSCNLLLLGDVMLGENYYHYCRGIRTNFENKYSQLINDKVKKILFSNIDFLFFNFEFSLVNSVFEFSDIYTSVYRARKECLSIFPDRIKKIVNIANNHLSQYGIESIEYTKSVLKKNGYLIVGETEKPLIVLINEKEIKFWGVSLIPDSNYCSGYFSSTYERVARELFHPPKDNNEYWVISIHWGDEYIRKSSEAQIKLAHKLSDLGFDLIIGHHPHVIQPIEIYNNTTIIYSLGNFIFDQNFSDRTKQGLAVNLLFNREMKIIRLYKTFQKKYKIVKCKSTDNYNLEEDNLYNIKCKLINFYMRLLMKIELFLHLNEVNKQTLKYLLLKKFK